MQSKNFLNKTVTVKIDRPLGSKHPKFNYIYQLTTAIFQIQYQVMVKR